MYNFKEDYTDNITIRILNADPIRDLREAGLNTAGKDYFDLNCKDKVTKIFENYLKSEHSPIRTIILRITMTDMYYPTSVHFARHVHTLHFVKSSRPDLTGKARDLNTPVNHIMDCNIQALLCMMRERLCKKCAKDTINWANSICNYMDNSENLLLSSISKFLVAKCQYRSFGCPEIKPCK